MSESRKNHLTIDGGQVKEDDKEHIGSYKPIPQGDGDFRKSPSRKSLEKASPDGASERLLQETDHPKIATRIDMTDAKYVVGGDHRNGDAKVELDANKKRHKHGSHKRHHHKREKTEETPKEEVDKNATEADDGQGPSGTQDRREDRDKENSEHRKHRRRKRRHHHRKHRPKVDEANPQKEGEESAANFSAQRARRMSIFPGSFEPNADSDKEAPKQSDDESRAAIADFIKRFEDGRASNSNSSYVQFSGLTKEELQRYQDDPFWVRLRWTLFTLFWLLWLCMLAGAITIIYQTPKCAAPKTWHAKGPFVAMTNEPYSEVEVNLPKLKESKIAAVFVKADSYTVLDENDLSINNFKNLLEKAKEYGVKLIVELIPNYVSTNSTWFTQSENRSAQYDTYFTWANSSGFDELNNRKPPNGWLAPTNKPAWQFSDIRGQYYLQQFDENTADLNFANNDVVKHFTDVLVKWMEAGASGVRLRNARHIFFYPSDGKLSEEQQAPAREAGAADHTMYLFWKHEHTRDLPQLAPLLQNWASVVKQHSKKDSEEAVFTLSEDGSRWTRDNSSWGLRPLSAEAQLASIADLRSLNIKLKHSPAIQFKSADSEVALFSLLLPATPVLDISQLQKNDSETGISKLVSLRSHPSIADGDWRLETVNSTNEDPLIAIVRWKGDTGYVGVYNPGSMTARGTLDPTWAPPLLTVYHVSADTHALNNYTINTKVSSDNVLVPPKSTVVLSFVPKTSTEN